MSESGLENWNPMAEDYSSVRFNSYTDDVQQQKFDLCSLFVKHIPIDLTPETFSSIFSEGGPVRRCKILPLKPNCDFTVGLVSYYNEVDASKAISCLNRKPPYNFIITNALQKNKDGLQLSRPMPSHISSAPYSTGSGRGFALHQNSFANDPQQQATKPLQSYNSCFASSKGRGLIVEDNKLTSLKVVLDGGKRVACMVGDIDDQKPGKKVVSPSLEMPELIPNEYLYCVYCQKVGIKSCESCKQPYCSQQCQLMDWPKHQALCQLFQTSKTKKGAAPDSSYVSDGSSTSSCSETVNSTLDIINALNKNDTTLVSEPKSYVRTTPRKRIDVGQKSEAVSESLPIRKKLINIKKEEIENQSLPLNKNEKVTVCHFQSPSYLWLQLETAVNALLEMEKQMSSNHINAVDCAVNDLCCINRNGKFCRAQVLEVGPIGSLVHLIDYGTRVTVKSSELHYLYPTLKKYPAQAICCNLVDTGGGGESIQWTDDDISSFGHYTTDKKYKAHAYKCANNIYDVSLVNEDGVSLYSILVESRKDPLDQISEAQNLPLKVPTVCSVLKQGMDVTILPISVEDNGVWGLLEDGSQGCIEAIKEIEEILQKSEGEDISMCCEEEDIAAGFSLKFQSYFRCVVLKRLRSSFLVRYLDYGNTEEINKLKSLAPALLQKPSYVVYCQKPDALSTTDFSTVFNQDLVNASVTNAKANTVELSFTKTNPQFFLNAYPWFHDIQTFNPTVQVPTKPNKIADKKIYKDSIVEKHLAIGSKHDVNIVAITPIEMYVQFVDDKKAFASMISEINLYCNSDVSKSYVPSKDEIVCCKFSLDNVWYRGQVLNKMENKYSILFIDYGNVELVTEVNVKSLPPKFASPKLAVNVSVLNIQNSHIPNLMKEKLTNEEWVMEVKDDKKPVGVMLSQKGVSLEKLLSIKLSPVKSLLTQKLPIISEFKKVHPVIGVNEVKACHIENEIYYCHLVKNFQKFSDMSMKLKECKPKPLAAAPGVGNVLCVKSRDLGCWFRAAFKSICDKSLEYNVSYVDFGNGERVPSENVKCLPEEFYVHPFYCFPIKIKNIEEVKVKPALNSTFSIRVNEILKDRVQIVELVIPKSTLPSISDLKKTLLPINKAADVSLSFVDSDLFYAHMLSSKEQLVVLETKLEQSASFPKLSYLPDKGDIVCAKFTDDGWYRGLIKDVFPDSKSCKVFFVDYGNSETISLDNMKVLPIDLCTFPIIAVPIKIQNVEEIQNSSSDTLTFPVKVAKVTSEGLQVVDIVKVEVTAQAQVLPESLTDVLICHKEGNIFYVQKVSDADTLKTIMEGVIDVGLKVSVNPAIGQLKCVKFPLDDCWYRGIIKEKTNDGSFKVFFVDFGNTDIVKEVKDLPSKYSSFPMISIPVIISNADELSETLMVDSLCTVKYTGKMVDNIQVARVCPPVSPIFFASLNSSPLDGTFESRFLNSEGKFYFICKSCDSNQLVKIENLLENFESNEIYHTPSVNEVLVVKGSNKKWQRGCVIETNEESKCCKVYFIDSGVTAKVAFCDMSYASKSISAIPVFVHKVLLDSNATPVVLGDCYRVSVVSVSEGNPIIKVLQRFMVSALKRRELPIGEKRQVMVVYFEKDLTFLQDNADFALVAKMQEELCVASGVVPSNPLVGELLCAHCESDGEWYRCCIEEVIACERYNVRYIDYGNCEEISKKSLRSFSDELASLPCFSMATKITNPVRTPVTLGQLYTVVAESGPKDNVQDIKLILPESKPSQAVKAVERSGGLATDFYLSVCNSKDDADVQFFHSDMSEIELNSGEQLIVIYSVLKNCYMYCAPFNQESISANVQLTADITEYCGKLNCSTYNKSSLPETGEMVLAKYHGDNQWYRASITDKSKAPFYEVFFVDYGNFAEVHKDSLRKMEKMFMSLEIQAHLCLLTGFEVEAQNLINVNEELKLFDIASGKGPLKASVNITPDSSITIEVPMITRYLVQKKLATAVKS